jgi:hypothetical protein
MDGLARQIARPFDRIHQQHSLPQTGFHEVF